MRALIAAVLLATAPALADEPAGQPMAERAGDDADRLLSPPMEQSRIEGWGYVESELVRIWPHRRGTVSGSIRRTRFWARAPRTLIRRSSSAPTSSASCGWGGGVVHRSDPHHLHAHRSGKRGRRVR